MHVVMVRGLGFRGCGEMRGWMGLRRGLVSAERKGGIFLGKKERMGLGWGVYFTRGRKEGRRSAISH